LARYTLVCDCGSDDLEHDSEQSKFICNECGNYYTENEAGHELVGYSND
jgi:transcription initiation factor IIE alpha subunit